MASPVLGIDLGTTNSVVAHADETRVRVLRDEDGHLLTPSCVSFLGEGETRVGGDARELRLVDAANTIFSIKRLIGRPFRSSEVRRAVQRLPFKLEEGPSGGVMVRAHGETYSLPEISSFILRRLRDIAEAALGTSCVNAVITVPANFNELQRMATRDAGRIAGLNVLRILNEPTAAALAYGYRAQQAQRIAVYDFGGGTFDISILELSGDVIEVIATAGDTQLGGDDLDRALADRMVAGFEAQHGVDLKQEPQQYERITMAAEWLKCQLSQLEAAEATIKEVAGAERARLDLKFRIGRSELHDLVSPLIGRTFTICEEALKLANVRPSQLDGVLLVGGQTRTPRVREMVAEYFGMQPKYSVDPDLAVAQGAALQGYALSGVPAADPDRRVVRTIAGAAGRPAGSDPFEDEPTRIGRERAEGDVPALEIGDSPFDEAPTTIARYDAAERAVHPALAYGPPSMRPEMPSVTHAATLAGVGAPLETVEANGGDAVANAPVTGAEPGRSPHRTHAETPSAKALGGRPKPPPAAAVRPVPPPPAAGHNSPEAGEVDLPAPPPAAGHYSPDASEIALLAPPTAAGHDFPDASEIDLLAPPPAPGHYSPDASEIDLLAPPPPAAGHDFPDASEIDLPAALRTARPAPAPANDEDDVSTALLASPKTKARTRSLEEPSDEAPTLAAAQRLAAEGQLERALSMYGELSVNDPNDARLQSEMQALRAKLMAASNPGPAAGSAFDTRPGLRRSLKPPPPPPARGRTQPKAAAPAALEPKPESVRSLLLSREDEGAAPPHTALSAQRKAHPSSVFPGPPSVAPLLLDVTPHTLSVETVGGFCEQIIERNAPIPTEQTRIFSTSRDNQVTVSVRVCQGESRRIDENQVLGQIDLLGLRQARRGEVSIEVTFELDADGTLNVRAIDEGTGQGQELQLNLVGAIEAHEIERMRIRQRAMTG